MHHCNECCLGDESREHDEHDRLVIVHSHSRQKNEKRDKNQVGRTEHGAPF